MNALSSWCWGKIKSQSKGNFASLLLRQMNKENGTPTKPTALRSQNQPHEQFNNKQALATTNAQSESESENVRERQRKPQHQPGGERNTYK